MGFKHDSEFWPRPTTLLVKGSPLLACLDDASFVYFVGLSQWSTCGLHKVYQRPEFPAVLRLCTDITIHTYKTDDLTAQTRFFSDFALDGVCNIFVYAHMATG